MPLKAAYHLGLHCLPKNLLTGISKIHEIEISAQSKRKTVKKKSAKSVTLPLTFKQSIISILAREFVTRSCLKPQNPCSNHEIHVLFELAFNFKKPKLGHDLHA